MTAAKGRWFDKYWVRDRGFYKKVVLILIPIVCQSIINQGVNMMDTIMVGKLGEASISASSLANQFYNIFVFLCMGISAAGDSLALSTPAIQDTARLTNLISKTNASTGIFIAVGLVAATCLVYRYTVVGYELKQVGENRSFARIGGVNVTKTFLAIFLLSGFAAGLCGSIEVQGTYGKFTASFSNNLGWDGIMIAMIAGNNPLMVLAVATLWGMLKAGSLHMERMCDVNRLTVLLIQALFVLFVTVDYKKLAGTLKRKAVAG